MPVPTPELGLLQAVDADDTADYLVTNLANSLVSVDALFNNASGHTHGGVHQGGPISSIPASAIPNGSITSALIADGTIQSADLAAGAVTSVNIAPPIDIGGMFRTSGQVGFGEGTGPAMELYYNGSVCAIQGYDRSTSLYMPVEIIGNRITLSISGGSNFVLDTSGNVEMTGALTVTGTITASSYLFLTDSTHFIEASGVNVVYACPASGAHLFEINAGGYAPVQVGTLTANGGAVITGTLNTSGLATVPQLALGAGGQFLLPVNNSIRYAAAATGYHSFEYAAGGPANIACGDVNASGQLAFNGAFSGGTVEAIGGSHTHDWQVVVNGTAYRIQLWQ